MGTTGLWMAMFLVWATDIFANVNTPWTIALVACVAMDLLMGAFKLLVR